MICHAKLKVVSGVTGKFSQILWMQVTPIFYMFYDPTHDSELKSRHLFNEWLRKLIVLCCCWQGWKLLSWRLVDVCGGKSSLTVPYCTVQYSLLLTWHPKLDEKLGVTEVNLDPDLLMIFCLSEFMVWLYEVVW